MPRLDPQAAFSAVTPAARCCRSTILQKVSVVNVSQIVTVDKSFLTERIGSIGPQTLAQVDRGLRLVLSLEVGG